MNVDPNSKYVAPIARQAAHRFRSNDSDKLVVIFCEFCGCVAYTYGPYGGASAGGEDSKATQPCPLAKTEILT